MASSGEAPVDTTSAEPFFEVETASTRYQVISYASVIAAQVLFALYAIGRYTYYVLKKKETTDAADFITARGTQSMWRVTFSYFASAVGAWCLVTPSQFAVYTGIVGLAMYAFASGIPVLIISLFGNKIQAMNPDVTSVADFSGKRFGPLFRTTVVLLALFNMAVAMLAEYITIGTLFQFFVNSTNYPIMIVVGCLTMFYTSYGGTYISIVTDQLQAILTIIFIGILVIYVAVTFRPEGGLPLPLNTDSNMGFPLGPNKFGYSAIFSMPCSLIAATVFSDAMWQKVWAGESKAAVVKGGLLGFLLITTAVFLFGFGGWLAAWGGLVTYDTNPNLFLFQIFNSDRGNGLQQAYVRSWVGVIALILAATMNESAIDSLQSGLTAALTSQYFSNQHTFFARMGVYIINIPLIIIAAKLGPEIPVLGLFLISNMLTSCCFLPVLSGVLGGVWERSSKYVTESAAIFGFWTSVFTVCCYGAGRHMQEMEYTCWTCVEDYGAVYPLESKSAAIRHGVWYAWYGNINYDWDYFLVASGFSIIGMLLWIGGAAVLRKFGIEGPGITGTFRSVAAALRVSRAFEIATGAKYQTDIMAVLTRNRFRAPDQLAAGPAPDSPSDSHTEVEKLAAKAEMYKIDDKIAEAAEGKAGPQPPIQA